MTSPVIQSDYLALQPLLVQRLEELVPAAAWAPIETLQEAIESAVRQPTGFVLWAGDRFDASEGRALGGAAQSAYQRWTILLATRDASQAKGAHRNVIAGPLLLAIHKALAGWAPAGHVRKFMRTTGRDPQYSPNVGLYPLTFEIQVFL